MRGGRPAIARVAAGAGRAAERGCGRKRLRQPVASHGLAVEAVARSILYLGGLTGPGPGVQVVFSHQVGHVVIQQRDSQRAGGRVDFCKTIATDRAGDRDDDVF